MLKELTVQNYALIEEARLHFGPGLNVLSGETGAGKSIIIDAVSLLLGERANQAGIRTGAEKAVIAGLFAVERQPAVGALLREMGLPEEGEYLLLSREVALSGNNVCRVNGQAVTLSMYQRFGSLLVDIHGQHRHQSLLSAPTQRQLLDGFTGKETLELRRKIKEVFTRWREKEESLQQLAERAEAAAREEDYLAYQLRELEQAALQAGEEEELDKERQRLAGAETLAAGAQNVRSLLYESAQGANSAYDTIGAAVEEIRKMARYDESLYELLSQLEQTLYQVEACAEDVRVFSERLTFDPQRLEEVEARLHLINKLKRKYGATIEEILAYREQAAASLEQLRSRDQSRTALEQEVAGLEAEYGRLAGRLTEARHQGAKILQQRLQGVWQELAMGATRFQAEVRESSPGPEGQDEVHFMFSSNPGEQLQPLAKIASGGEMSRVMLALKAALAEIDAIPTLIFDEIDSGIGGETVGRVADKLVDIGRCRQVLCVTHSARIAAAAGRHFVVSKTVLDDRTKVAVQVLGEEERLQEVTRMLGGDPAARQLAKHLRNKN